MKTHPDSEPGGGLLDAVLRDESWQAASAAFKAEALGAFHARQRQRRVARWGGAFVVVAGTIAAALLWLGNPAAKSREVALNRAAPVVSPRSLSDQELLGLFPQGSCFLAEIDGQKELIFLDPKDEQTYLSKAGKSGW